MIIDFEFSRNTLTRVDATHVEFKYNSIRAESQRLWDVFTDHFDLQFRNLRATNPRFNVWFPHSPIARNLPADTLYPLANVQNAKVVYDNHIIQVNARAQKAMEEIQSLIPAGY